MKNVVEYTLISRIYRVGGSIFNAICVGTLKRYVALPKPVPDVIAVEFSATHAKDAFQFNSRGALIDIDTWGGPLLYNGFEDELKRQWRKGNNYLRILY